ncbi:hypothetical protein [Brevibacterium antiquum]|uniref:hypothetical protein n=1 Tax=Brevibacterium antiquum TaxID=234835 RepID=UPI0018DF998C|nr:hypothetical protein [Brevibacterium antiquum]
MTSTCVEGSGLLRQAVVILLFISTFFPGEAVVAEVVSTAVVGDSAPPEAWIEERGITEEGIA